MEPEQKKLGRRALTRIFAESLAVGVGGGGMMAGVIGWMGHGRGSMAAFGVFFAAIVTAAYFTSRVEIASRAEKRMKKSDCCGKDDKPAP